MVDFVLFVFKIMINGNVDHMEIYDFDGAQLAWWRYNRRYDCCAVVYLLGIELDYKQSNALFGFGPPPWKDLRRIEDKPPQSTKESGTVDSRNARQGAERLPCAVFRLYGDARECSDWRRPQ